jgi:hypothetical protein
MRKPKIDRRKYERYDTEVKIYFRVNYDIKTKVKFQLLNNLGEKLLSEKYFGISRNVGAEGMRFSSNKKLNRGDVLYIEVYLPRQKQPVCMTGEVRWSKEISPYPVKKYKFDTGVKLIDILGKPVAKSIYFDKKHSIVWSIVLESIFGNFRKFVRKYG